MEISIGYKLLSKLKDPEALLFRVTAQLFPRYVWNQLLASRTRTQFAGAYLLFSFDCDTEEDSEVVLGLDERLRNLGLFPAYAVPGELILAAPEIYKELRDRGADFLNHGNRRHTRFNPEHGCNESYFFYDKATPNEVREDIERGDHILRRVLGVDPVGFRTPHFGTFQKAKDLKFLYGILKELNYKISSSTMPQKYFSRGACFLTDGIYELPVTGAFSRPYQILDSWTYFDKPKRQFTSRDYLDEAKKTAEFVSKRGVTGIFNYYADPKHVANEENFFEAVKVLLAVAKPLRFGATDELVRKKL